MRSVRGILFHYPRAPGVSIAKAAPQLGSPGGSAGGGPRIPAQAAATRGANLRAAGPAAAGGRKKIRGYDLTAGERRRNLTPV